MRLVEETHPILLQKCELFNFDEPIMDTYELSEGWHKVRKDGAGVGLAAPQVGLNTQVLVIGMGNYKTEGAADYDQVYFNPTILSYEEGNIYMLEGCLRYPGLVVKVKRPENMTMEWYTEEGSRCEERFVGMTSRILQHEVDHLNGITFLKRAVSYHLQKAQKDRKIQGRRRKKTQE